MRLFSRGFYWLLMLAVCVDGLVMLSHAQAATMASTGNVPMVHTPGTPECFVMGADGRS